MYAKVQLRYQQVTTIFVSLLHIYGIWRHPNDDREKSVLPNELCEYVKG